MKTVLVAILLSLGTATAQLAPAPPASAGFSAERLSRVDAVMKEHVKANHMGGGAGLIARNGKIVFKANWGDIKPDSIVRMYSMTKGVTGVAAMILYDEGKFALSDPLSKYLPEFKDMSVGVPSTDATHQRTYTVAKAERPITVRDLFRHTSGLDYAGPMDEHGVPAYRAIGMIGGAPMVTFDLAEAVKRLASVPLNDQPGTMWRYGYSIDVLGRLVEVLSGKTLDQFFEERIFKPLGMKDSAFYVAEAKWPRLATLYAPKADGIVQKSTSPAQESFKKKPTIFYGGAGLTSTLDDYARFYQMLLNEGEFNGVRILSRKAVEMMCTDQIGNLPHADITLPAWDGFGLTFAVSPGPGKSPDPTSAGTFRWGGAAGTSFWIDPKEHMIGIFLVQILPSDFALAGQFQRLAYSALN